MISRRKFLGKAGGIAGSIMILPTWVIGKQKSPNSKLNVALIGVGGIGGQAMENIGSAPEVKQLSAMSTITARLPTIKRCHQFHDSATSALCSTK